MIELTQGDILRADAEALVNTVNCVGVMGRGIALQFKKAFPENFKRYKAVCDKKELQPGKMYIHDLNRFLNPRYVINFPTKRHWRGKSRMADIEAGLKTLVVEVRQRGIHSVAIPPLGCGLGGLPWVDVRARIEDAFNDLKDVRVLLYEPKGAPPAEKMVRLKKSAGFDRRAGRFARFDAPVSCGGHGSSCNASGDPQIDVFYAGGGRGIETSVQQRPLWTVCPEPAPRVDSYGRAFHQRVWRCGGQSGAGNQPAS